MEILSIIIYILNPFAGIIFLSFGMINKSQSWSKHNQKLLFLLSLLCSIFIAVVNTTKVAENDLVWYTAAYKMAKDHTFLGYIPYSGVNFSMPCTDFGYDFYVWSLCKITNANVWMFYFVTTIINYLVLSLSIIKISKYFNLKISVTVVAIIVLCFFPFIYTMSLQLVRQFMAGSFLMLLLANLLYSRTLRGYIIKNWWIMLIMFGFHKSSFFFIVLFFCTFLRHSFRTNKVLYIAFFVILAFYQFIAAKFSGFLGESDSSVSIALQRASVDNNSLTAGTMKISKMLSLLIFLLTSFYLAYFKINKVDNNGQFKHLCNIIIITSIFCFANLSQEELSNRFFYYLLPCFPLLYIAFSARFRFSKTFNIFLVIFCMFAWGEYLDIVTWTYNIPMNVFLCPLIYY